MLLTALFILLVFYGIYIGMILLIATASPDYYGNWKQFWIDLVVPFGRFIRESLTVKK